jgi:hypothetical protein
LRSALSHSLSVSVSACSESELENTIFGHDFENRN